MSAFKILKIVIWTIINDKKKTLCHFHKKGISPKKFFSNLNGLDNLTLYIKYNPKMLIMLYKMSLLMCILFSKFQIREDFSN